MMLYSVSSLSFQRWLRNTIYPYTFTRNPQPTSHRRQPPSPSVAFLSKTDARGNQFAQGRHPLGASRTQAPSCCYRVASKCRTNRHRGLVQFREIRLVDCEGKGGFQCSHRMTGLDRSSKLALCFSFPRMVLPSVSLKPNESALKKSNIHLDGHNISLRRSFSEVDHGS